MLLNCTNHPVLPILNAETFRNKQRVTFVLPNQKEKTQKMWATHGADAFWEGNCAIGGIRFRRVNRRRMHSPLLFIYVIVYRPSHEDGHHRSNSFPVSVEVVRGYLVEVILISTSPQSLKLRDFNGGLGNGTPTTSIHSTISRNVHAPWIDNYIYTIRKSRKYFSFNTNEKHPSNRDEKDVILLVVLQQCTNDLQFNNCVDLHLLYKHKHP